MGAFVFKSRHDLEVGDNGVHGSASPFEAMAERLNWLHETLEKDPFAKAPFDLSI